VITKLLGRGGAATVYEIWNPKLEMYRAVKIINPNAVEMAHKRFQTEFKISAKLKHPNIVEIHGVGDWRGLPYIEMEKIDGIGLDRIIAQRGALPPSVCTSVGIMICRALDYAHTQPCVIFGKCYQGVIHRDLKPQNIMVCRSGAVKLMDFGIARPIDVTFQTIDGLISGTLQFLSPEQLEKGTLDFRTDLYSLGVTMYECVMGVNPFPQSSFVNLVSHKSKNKFLPIDTFPAKLPGRLKRIIYKCMQFDPQKRVASAAILLKELTDIHRSLTNETPESIMVRLLSDETGRKVVLAARRRFPWRPIAATVSFCFFLFCFYRFGMHDAQKLFFRSITSIASSPIHAALHRFSPRSSGAPPLSNHVSISAPLARDSTATPQPSAPLTVISAHGNTAFRAASKLEPKKSLMESLKTEYGMDDTFAIMEKACQSNYFSTVLAIFNVLTPKQAKSPQALIFKLRALEGIGDNDQLSEYLENATLNDAELYLAKARFSYKNKNIPGCKLMIAISLKSPHVLLDYDILKREVYYLSALCATEQFDAQPNEQSYKDALDTWWQLKSALRSDPDHAYNKKAALELQRLAKKMQKG
jgi:serine/threonine protein kinase